MELSRPDPNSNGCAFTGDCGQWWWHKQLRFAMAALGEKARPLAVTLPDTAPLQIRSLALYRPENLLMPFEQGQENRKP